ncbi:MAG: hypothetical protein ASARMPREDX12_009295 [Alectoria sarmentosa]|nr:MAG: hypothetical protein ASARMPREDX12_009295 [Alectoria sarmentosa]
MDRIIPQVDALTVRELQHELRKRGLPVSGIKKDLRRRVMEALGSEYADGWTLGYLLNMKIIPFNGRGRDPQTLVGRHVTGLSGWDDDNTMTIMLSDDEDQTIVCQAADADDLNFGMDQELFDLFYTSSNEERTYEKKPLLVTEAAMALCKDHQGVVAATILGIKLAGMKEMGFFDVNDDGKPDGTSWAKLGVDVWLAGEEEAGFEGDVSAINEENVVKAGTNSLLDSLLAGNDGCP